MVEFDYFGSLVYCRFPEIDALKMVDCAFSTRLGGMSEGKYEALNLGLHVGDVPCRVLTNRKHFFEALNMSPETWVSAEQVHGDLIQIVTKKYAGRGLLEHKDSIPGVDGLITQDMGVSLVAFFADCVPVFLIDPRKRVIGLVHAGWKGTVSKVPHKAVQTMECVFGSRPEDCVALIGPSIGACCYEIGIDVAEKVSEAFPHVPNILSADTTGERIFCDLQIANRTCLEFAGLLPENIHSSGLCTSCRTDIFYSYRKEGTTGRLAGVIRLC
jgi:YfiH family protein